MMCALRGTETFLPPSCQLLLHFQTQRFYSEILHPQGETEGKS